MIVREYADNDFDRVNEIILNSFGYERKKVKNDMAHEFVACIDDIVVGYLILNEMIDIIKNKKVFHIDYVCVDPNYRGKNIGYEMMNYVMDYASGVWSNDAFGDRGWLAIALVIFSIWNPLIGIFASILFGGLYIVYLYIPTGMDYMEFKELYKMIPYVVTLFVLVLTSMRNKKENQPPASLGLSFFREER